MRILLVAPSFNVGGIERNIQLLAKGFCDEAIDVTVLVLHDSKRYINYDDRCTVKAVSGSRGKLLHQRLLYRVLLPSKIRNCVKKVNPEYVISLADTFNAVVVLALLGLASKVIIGDVTKPDRKFHWTTTLLKKVFYPYSFAFIAQTNSAKQYYVSKFKNRLKIYVIPPVLMPITVNIDCKKEKYILNVGRLSFEKGQDRLIEIFNSIENKDGWKLCLTADGPYKSKIIELIEKYDLRDNVILLGFVEDMDDLYSKASIFAMTSRFEGYPNALIEAMSAGLPSVVYNTFPVDEIITNNYDGIIINDNDFNHFKSSITRLMEDKELRDSLGKASKSINNRLSSDIIINKYIQILKESK